MAHRVLVVDDDVAVAERSSAPRPWPGTTPRSPIAAPTPSAARQQRPEVVVLDIISARHVGIDVRRHMRANPELRPCRSSSPPAAIADKIEGFEAGAMTISPNPLTSASPPRAPCAARNPPTRPRPPTASSSAARA